MSNISPYDAMFSSIIGQDYDMLQLLSPAAAEMSRLVGSTVNACPAGTKPLQIVELGGGTGVTTLALLTANETLQVFSIDNEPVMQQQAKQRLQQWVDQGRLTFCDDDALTALQKLASDSVDVIASAYTLHNFLNNYREQVLKEVFRVLKPNGKFINADRYGLNDISQHTLIVQEEVKHYFKVLAPLNRPDLLEQWIVHLFSDESENHIMREAVALQQLQDCGFTSITVSDRNAINALVTAKKPPNENSPA
ncbi:class I SAM-dependent methyltransferase [Methylobacter sp. S3L5C]|uniref:class I SAM-dependent methyltransferase n=1 Tax=Methylobacter sp. S3L5C TaxID=2839024 RepID=UPI001FAE505A|nr:class I SAM-dependent methyltransferase [Methylobacter sp. S3L5C]UOA07964.1 class I SAM-dependent methyltransferase [Methylobacter sp. S3L5C]